MYIKLFKENPLERFFLTIYQFKAILWLDYAWTSLHIHGKKRKMNLGLDKKEDISLEFILMPIKTLEILLINWYWLYGMYLQLNTEITAVLQRHVMLHTESVTKQSLKSYINVWILSITITFRWMYHHDQRMMFLLFVVVVSLYFGWRKTSFCTYFKKYF